MFPSENEFLRGQRALITGCRRGIGLAIAEAFAKAGADVIGSSRVIEAGDSDARRRVEAAGRSFVPLAVDLTTPDGPDALARAALEIGPIDILVSNAGAIERVPAVEHSTAAWDAVLATNLRSGFVLAREVGRPMLERGSGKVVFMASILSFQGGLGVVSYAAAKSGLAGLVRALANEWAPLGVNVNAIAPGYVETEMTDTLRSNPRRAKELLDRIPASRWGRPKDVANATLFLVSPAADYIHGVVLPVDGGWLSR